VSTDPKGGVGSFQEAKVTLSELDESVKEIAALLTTISPKVYWFLNWFLSCYFVDTILSFFIFQIPSVLQSVISRKEFIARILESPQLAHKITNPRDLCEELKTNLEIGGQELNASAAEITDALDKIPIAQTREDLEGVEEVLEVAEEIV